MPRSHARAEDLLHLAVEGGGIAEGRVALARLEQDEHGELGQVVAGEHVDGPVEHHLARGRQPVTVEAGAIGDAQDIAACLSRTFRLTGWLFGVVDDDQDAPGVDLVARGDIDLGHHAAVRAP